MVSKAFCSSLDCTCLIIAIFLLPLVTFSLIWWVKSDFWSKETPKCFWYDDCTTGILLNTKNGWDALMAFFQEIITFWTCFWESGLNNIFHWWAHLKIRTKSLFSWSIECLISWTMENTNVSLGKSFTDDTSLDRSFI